MKLIVFALVRFASLNAEFVGAGENGKTERESKRIEMTRCKYKANKKLKQNVI